MIRTPPAPTGDSLDDEEIMVRKLEAKVARFNDKYPTMASRYGGLSWMERRWLKRCRKSPWDGLKD